MKNLSQANYYLIKNAVNTEGTFNPDEIMYLFEEQLTSDQYDDIYSFLSWVDTNNKPFGSGNYKTVYKQYINSLKTNSKMENLKKKCTCCERSLVISENFYKNKNTKDGYVYQCKACYRLEEVQRKAKKGTIKAEKEKNFVIGQFSKDDKFVAGFENFAEVKKETGFNTGNIKQACEGKRKSANGFIWKYNK